ncbi:AAA family ATPase [Chitinibacter sp. FCG-7]|uniref:AAA family ATPase n=1 Tax=Chitinibacter mangrovi TaxID=3153927 RepID=A0AAU7F8V6_9NEIS
MSSRRNSREISLSRASFFNKTPDFFTVRLDVLELKSVINLRGLYFTPERVTALLGANCVGKSTILHALACAYQPKKNGEDHKFSEFFRPNPDATWDGSECRVYTKEKVGKSGSHIAADNYFKKDRWFPRHDRKRRRDVYYVGIFTTLPMLEYIRFVRFKNSNNATTFKYKKTEMKDDLHKAILKYAASILNRSYEGIFEFSAVGYENFLGLSIKGNHYSQLSMGAGEQRILKILKVMLCAEEGSLVLIDEVDLLLHDAALAKMLDCIIEIAEKRKLQVIFSTHRDLILKCNKKINVRYLLPSANGVKVLDKPNPDLVESLSGLRPKTISIYVEDTFSSVMAGRVARELGVFRLVDFVKYGPARNAFVVAGSSAIQKKRNCLFILDGDEYKTDADKKNQLNSILTGSNQEMKDARAYALSSIGQYELPDGTSPEEHIHNVIVSLPSEYIPDALREYYEALKGIHAVHDKHDYIDSVVNAFGIDEVASLNHVFDLFSLDGDKYSLFVSRVKEKIENFIALNPI